MILIELQAVYINILSDFLQSFLQLSMQPTKGGTVMARKPNIILILAVAYLTLKFIFPKTLNSLLGKNNNGNCGEGDCNCH